MSKNAESRDASFIDPVMPGQYSHLITQEDYAMIINIIASYFEKGEKQLADLKNASFRVLGKGGEMICEYSLSNLVRHLSCLKKSDWKSYIHSFFQNTDIHFPAYDFYFNDYDHARKHLKVLVKPGGFNPKGMNGKLVTKEHFPGTLSALVFHFNQQFRFLSKEDVMKWNIPEEELLEEALANIGGEKLMVEAKDIEKGLRVYGITSNQYSAAAMVHMERKFPYLAGKAGTVFSIPANGTAFAVPVDDDKDLERIFRPLLNITALAYQREPSPITYDLFHHCNGETSSMLEVLRSFHPEGCGMFR